MPWVCLHVHMGARVGLPLHPNPGLHASAVRELARGCVPLCAPGWMLGGVGGGWSGEEAAFQTSLCLLREMCSPSPSPFLSKAPAGGRGVLFALSWNRSRCIPPPWVGHPPRSPATLVPSPGSRQPGCDLFLFYNSGQDAEPASSSGKWGAEQFLTRQGDWEP